MNTSALSVAHSALVLDMARLHPLHLPTLIRALEDGSSVPLCEKVVWSVMACLQTAPPLFVVPSEHQWDYTGDDVGQHIARWIALEPEFKVEPMQVHAVLIGVFRVGEFQAGSGVGATTGGGVQASGTEAAELTILKEEN